LKIKALVGSLRLNAVSSGKIKTNLLQEAFVYQEERAAPASSKSSGALATAIPQYGVRLDGNVNEKALRRVRLARKGAGQGAAVVFHEGALNFPE
jgi:hypothetical protein